ncbi:MULTISPECIES: hypothetical protein [Sorangium]|uniref:Secreted protein n=1 Tax=Sorangium cellulosum TaxID=56 RepID=A0A4P2R152_SORCE|nr:MULTISPECIES: hypothetical protein [Sorangium]AUX36368.1 hypothetical protein SOCE836_085750 [Sorangium cellulosum]WCQ95667.1 hypothetical protein NQZ70_08444 [Sorangium sp. Soce836]
MRLCGLAFALCAALLMPCEASAEEGFHVVVVRPRRAGKVVEEATVRLTGELRAVGFSVRSAEGTSGTDGRAQVEGADGTLAAIAILESDRGAAADIWVADHVMKKTVVRRVELGDPEVTNAVSDLAVRSAELLRASLVEVIGARRRELPPEIARWIAQASPPAERALSEPAKEAAEPPKETAGAAQAGARTAREAAGAANGPTGGGPALPERRAPHEANAAPRVAELRRDSLEAGSAHLIGELGGVSSVYLRVEHALAARLSLRATFVPGILEHRLDAPAGSVTLRQTLATVGLAYAFDAEAARLYPVIALGVGAYHASIDGQASLPAEGRHQDFVTAGLALGGGLGVRITPELTALAQLDVVLLATEPVLAVAGTEVGRTGRPALLSCVGLKLSY